MPRRRTFVVPLIIFINVVIFVMWMRSTQTQNSFMARNFLVSWDALKDGRYWLLISSVFSHNMILHILINMFVLKSFGTFMEQVLGPAVFTAFYLAAGVISSLSHCMVSAFILHVPEMQALGASGAIAGLVLLFALTFPKEKILILGFIPVPAIIGGLVFIGLDIWGVVAQAKGGGLPIGHGAHLGGAFTGILFYFIYVRPRQQRQARMMNLES